MSDPRGRRELRTCPVEGRTVLINTLIQTLPMVSTGTSGGRAGQRAEHGGWNPHDPPWLGVEGHTAVHRDPAVHRDGLGAHEHLRGDLPDCLALAVERISDLRGDRRLRSFKLAGRAVAGRSTEMDLVALPFETPLSNPERWRDREVGGARCLQVWDDAVAILAWAPRVPMETWILPRTGRASFGSSSGGAVGGLTSHTLLRLHAALHADIDVVLVDGEPWRIELRPRVVAPSVYTLATDMDAHGWFPELAAAWLQDFCPA
ncbi:MAG: hypothetical protein EXR69_11690 [Myxococcales bacterium]|nr:hypothetical protein [Myxococcales bacterium]